MTALREIRKKANVSQEALAGRLGVTVQAISLWETGGRKPDIITLKKLSIIFGVTTDELLEPIKVEI